MQRMLCSSKLHGHTLLIEMRMSKRERVKSEHVGTFIVNKRDEKVVNRNS